uniref:Uncharacterized protein n=1 Tax=Sus scrofa TaxID=9823 RepID=A0A287B098_PIG
MADHLLLAEGYRLVPRPPPPAPAQGPHVLRTLQPYSGPGLDSGLRPRGTPLGPPPPPPPGALTYGALGRRRQPSSPFRLCRRRRPPAARTCSPWRRCTQVARPRPPAPREAPGPTAGARSPSSATAATRARSGLHGRRTHRRGGADVAGAGARAAPRARAARALPGPERVRLLLGLGFGAARWLGELLSDACPAWPREGGRPRRTRHPAPGPRHAPSVRVRQRFAHRADAGPGRRASLQALLAAG